MELKRMEKEDNSFMANGLKYDISESLSLDRYRQFEKLQIRVGFGTDFENIFKAIKGCYETIEQGKFGTTAVKLHNLMNGVIAKMEDREDPMLMLCALFINREDEDPGVYDEKLAKAKISDWIKEGYDVRDFFSLAKTLVNGFTPIYDSVSQATSKVKKEKV